MTVSRAQQAVLDERVAQALIETLPRGANAGSVVVTIDPEGVTFELAVDRGSNVNATEALARACAEAAHGYLSRGEHPRSIEYHVRRSGANWSVRGKLNWD